MAFDDISNLNNHPEVAQALGNMLVAWSFAETAIQFALASVCDIPVNQAMMGYYRIPTFEARVKFILAMIPEWDTAKHDKAAIHETIEAISGLAGTRNNWVHNVWSTRQGTGEPVVINLRASENNGRVKAVKAHDINQHAETVIKHAKALRKLIPEQPFQPLPS